MAGEEERPEPIAIRMGGYGPATTGFSRALKFIGDRLAAEFGDRLRVNYVWNIMELGYRAEDILWLAYHGFLTRGHYSSTYPAQPLPYLWLVFLPFLSQRSTLSRAWL